MKEACLSFLSEREGEEIVKIVKKGDYDLIREKPNLLARFSFRGRSLFLKEFKRKKIFSFLLSPLRPASSRRAFEIGQLMMKAGVLTPEPILSFEERRWGFVRRDFLITEDIGEHRSAREVLLHGNVEVLLKVAEIVRKLHENGIYHRDLNLSNFLIKGDEIYLVDNNRVRKRRKPLSIVRRALDICRIDLHGYERYFLEKYTEGMKYSSLLCYLAILFMKIRKLRKVRRFFVEMAERLFSLSGGNAGSGRGG